jgi:Zn-finger nucleic acid-binding protein
MNCPYCATRLQVINRHGVEIDWCPECKGVWLERGELDKIIARATDDDDDDDDRRRPDRDDRRPRDDDRDRDRDDRRPRDDDRDRDRDRDRDGWRPGSDDRDDGGYAKRKKKKSFLSELFEFD